MIMFVVRLKGNKYMSDISTLITKEFNEMPIVITDYITKTVRKRTHKKKRIDKKWLKKYGYTEVQDESKVYMFDDKLFMSKNVMTNFWKEWRMNEGIKQDFT